MILENYDLKKHNTFGVHSKAKFYIEVDSEKVILDLLKSDIFKNEEHFILGGGSNVLFLNNFDGLVINNNIQGIEIIEDNATNVLIKCNGGVNWHHFVTKCLENNWYGLENLALIPGKVGAAPVQNIGAYGVEQDQFFEKLECIDLTKNKKIIFNKEECDFSYRDSIFKNKLKNKVIITSVYYRLSKVFKPNLSYRDLTEKLDENCTPNELFQTVIDIRNSKLPDPELLGNAGSFFKNPIINEDELQRIISKEPNLKYFKNNDNNFKIPAAWLIEHCGWKGKRIGDAGVSQNHALILINYGNASGKDIYELSEKIIESVKNRFGIILEREVNII